MEFGWGISSSILVVSLLCTAASSLTIRAIALLSACLRHAAHIVAKLGARHTQHGHACKPLPQFHNMLMRVHCNCGCKW